MSVVKRKTDQVTLAVIQKVTNATQHRGTEAAWPGLGFAVEEAEFEALVLS